MFYFLSFVFFSLSFSPFLSEVKKGEEGEKKDFQRMVFGLFKPNRLVSDGDLDLDSGLEGDGGLKGKKKKRSEGKKKRPRNQS